MKKLALTVTLLALWAIKAVHAAEFFCPSGDVTCLIAAINTANQNFQQNTINLEAGTYALTMVDNETDGTGLPSITGRITIRGQGSSQTTIERDNGGLPVFSGPQFRIFKIQAGAVLNLESLAVRRGVTTRSSGSGGNIHNSGNLTISQSDISQGNSETNSGGGIQNEGSLIVLMSRIFDNIGDGSGSGISNSGTATIEDSFIFRNTAFQLFGGGIDNSGELTIARTNLVNNSAPRGGGLANSGTANLKDVFFWLNRSFENFPNPGGGAIWNGFELAQLNIVSSTIARTQHKLWVRESSITEVKLRLQTQQSLETAL